MMNPIAMTVDCGSGPQDVTVCGPDYKAYEDKYDKSLSDMLTSGRYTFWTFLAWSAMNREGKTLLDYDAFVATTPQIEVGKVKELVPLESDQPIG